MDLLAADAVEALLTVLGRHDRFHERVANEEALADKAMEDPPPKDISDQQGGGTTGKKEEEAKKEWWKLGLPWW